VFGLVVSSLLVSGLMLMNYTKGLVDAFTFVILLATLTTLVPYAFSAAAQAYLYVTEPELFERRLFVRDMLIAALAFGYSVWAITGSGKDIIAKGFVLLLAGIPVYVYVGWRKRRDADRLAAALEAPPEPERRVEVVA
jgi:APA family basic amino acid/polyamine antiporter